MTAMNEPEGAKRPRKIREPSLAEAIIPLVTLAVLIGGSLLLFGLDALDGPIQVALMLCALTAALIILKNGHTWEEIQYAAQGSETPIAMATPTRPTPIVPAVVHELPMLIEIAPSR